MVGPQQEDAQVVRLVGSQRMQLERFLEVLGIDKAVDGPVRVASDIAEHTVLSRDFVQAVNGEDGEELVECPEVGKRLEHREVAHVS